MRTRDKRYKDYEITRENRDFLLALCRMEKPEVQGLLRQSCEESNDQIAELLYQNLSQLHCKGLSQFHTLETSG